MPEREERSGLLPGGRGLCLYSEGKSDCGPGILLRRDG